MLYALLYNFSWFATGHFMVMVCVIFRMLQPKQLNHMKLKNYKVYQFTMRTRTQTEKHPLMVVPCY